MHLRRLIAGFLSLASASSAGAAEFGCLHPEYRDGSFMVRGPWQVVEGDTVKIGDFTVYLMSIDAPSIDQKCRAQSGAEFACGKLVQEMLFSKFAANGPVATCLVHFSSANAREGEGFCGTFEIDPYFGVECITQDFGGELARDGFARVIAVGEFPTSSLYWAGYLAQKERRGLFAGQILPASSAAP